MNKELLASNITILIFGIILGLLMPFAVDWVLFNDPTPINITKTYEDGSFTGCMAKGLCNN